MTDIRDTPEHVQQCPTCWLRQLGLEPELVAVIITVSAEFAWSAAVGSIRANGGMTFQMPTMTEPAVAEILHRIRAMSSVPPSPEVAKTMARRRG